MKLALFNCRPYDRDYFLRCRDETHAGTIELTFYEFPLELKSMSLAEGHDAVCTFVNDVIDRDLLQALHTRGIDKLVLRCAGYNQVDLKAARELGFKIAHVPAYSPYAVAEHALALILTLNRKTHRAYNRVRDGNFSINGLLGFDIHGKAVGVIGMGIIGRAFADIMLGMNCRLTAYDVKPDPQM
ncbi:MAG: NAD(P)-dependent oxidoreductase, partial [Verrucomicrobiota bacterium]